LKSFDKLSLWNQNIYKYMNKEIYIYYIYKYIKKYIKRYIKNSYIFLKSLCALNKNLIIFSVVYIFS